MEIVISCVAAFLAATLTFFSGFGLGTMLTPVFAIFFPIDIAIALTGFVHFSNNLFKFALVGRNTNMAILLRFGVPAVLSSFVGAWLLLSITGLPTILKYQLRDRVFEITPVNLIIAILLVLFAVLEIIPAVQKIRFGKSKLVFGGVLSGFFGGLTGIQGAIRSAFLIKSELSKEAYIATGVVIACLVDITRLSVYASRFVSSSLNENAILLVSATLSAIAGTFMGRTLIHKVTLRNIQLLVAVMLILISIALGLGLV